LGGCQIISGISGNRDSTNVVNCLIGMVTNTCKYSGTETTVLTWQQLQKQKGEHLWLQLESWCPSQVFSLWIWLEEKSEWSPLSWQGYAQRLKI